MCGIIVLGTLLGQWLDSRLLPGSEVAWFTLLCSLASLTAALYLMILKSGKGK